VNSEQALAAIKDIVVNACTKFDPDFHSDLVYWEHESGPAYGNLTCKLSMISSREESTRDFSATDTSVEQSSLILATVQLTFESIETTTTDYFTAHTFSERVRQHLSSRQGKLYTRDKKVAVLSTHGPMTYRRKTLDGALMGFLSFETKWRYEFGLDDQAETVGTIQSIVFEGSVDIGSGPEVEMDFTI